MSSAVNKAIDQLLDVAGVHEHRDFARQMLKTSIGLAAENADSADVRIAALALHEMRRSFNAFAPYRGIPKCSIFGSARLPADSPACHAARSLGAQLASIGWMVITGGGPGVMTAGIEGAGAHNAFGLTIRLPFEVQDGGGFLDEERLLRFRYFFTRKLTFMKESAAYVIFPGGFGTLDETFELLTLLQTGKENPCPVVLFEPEDDRYWQRWREFIQVELVEAGMIRADDLELVSITSSIEEAVGTVESFYRNFHSLRYVEGRPVIRLQHQIDTATCEQLTREYEDMLLGSAITAVPCSEAELIDRDEIERPRISFDFDKRSFARLHELIRSINSRELLP